MTTHNMNKATTPPPASSLASGRKANQHKQKCLKCGRYLKQLRDPITKTYTGHLWRCSCMKPDFEVSIG